MSSSMFFILLVRKNNDQVSKAIIALKLRVLSNFVLNSLSFSIDWWDRLNNFITEFCFIFQLYT